MTLTYSAEFIDSDKDTHFTSALALDAVEEEDISFPADWATAGIQKCVVKNVSILSDQALDWELQFYSTDAKSSTDADLDSIITTLEFAAADAKQNAGTGLYRYDLDPSTFPFNYIDNDSTSEFHLILANRDAVSKNAGGTGEIKIRITAEPSWW